MLLVYPYLIVIEHHHKPKKVRSDERLHAIWRTASQIWIGESRTYPSREWMYFYNATGSCRYL